MSTLNRFLSAIRWYHALILVFIIPALYWYLIYYHPVHESPKPVKICIAREYEPILGVLTPTFRKTTSFYDRSGKITSEIESHRFIIEDNVRMYKHKYKKTFEYNAKNQLVKTTGVGFYDGNTDTFIYQPKATGYLVKKIRSTNDTTIFIYNRQNQLVASSWRYKDEEEKSPSHSDCDTLYDYDKNGFLFQKRFNCPLEIANQDSLYRCGIQYYQHPENRQLIVSHCDIIYGVVKKESRQVDKFGRTVSTKLYDGSGNLTKVINYSYEYYD